MLPSFGRAWILPEMSTSVICKHPRDLEMAEQEPHPSPPGSEALTSVFLGVGGSAHMSGTGWVSLCCVGPVCLGTAPVPLCSLLPSHSQTLQSLH